MHVCGNVWQVASHDSLSGPTGIPGVVRDSPCSAFWVFNQQVTHYLIYCVCFFINFLTPTSHVAKGHAVFWSFSCAALLCIYIHLPFLASRTLKSNFLLLSISLVTNLWSTMYCKVERERERDSVRYFWVQIISTRMGHFLRTEASWVPLTMNLWWNINKKNKNQTSLIWLCFIKSARVSIL